MQNTTIIMETSIAYAQQEYLQGNRNYLRIMEMIKCLGKIRNLSH